MFGMFDLVFRFIDLVDLIERLYKDEDFSAIYCAQGEVWIRNHDWADACPARGLYDAPVEWQERVRPLKKYPAWMVRLAAYVISGESLIYKSDRFRRDSWSLDVRVKARAE